MTKASFGTLFYLLYSRIIKINIDKKRSKNITQRVPSGDKVAMSKKGKPSNVAISTIKGCLVPKAGLEPARVLPLRILSPARLPVPPLRLGTILDYHMKV